MTSLILTAPLAGWVVPLDEVPDPVFAGRMLGDGVAIDPTGSTLHAPCDGTIVGVHASRHAVTIRADEGAEILMHVGIDTVGLGGEGFTAHVAEGQRVARGAPLVSFDLAAVTLAASAVVTPILVTNGEAFAVVRCKADRAIAVGDALMTVEACAPVGHAAVEGSGDERRATLSVPLAHGIHARPAARIAECARGFSAMVTLRAGDRSADARSPVAMLTLGVRHGDTLDIAATGADADDALAAIVALIESGMGESTAAPAPVPPAAPRAALREGMIAGVTAAPGLAIGRAVWLRATDRPVPATGAGAAAERARLEEALAQLRSALTGGAGQAAAILAAHRAIVDDPALHAAATESIDAGASAEWGWRTASRAQAEALRGLGDARLAERADDLLDIERRVIATLAGEAEVAPLHFARGTILLADDLLPSQVIGLDLSQVVGLCTMRGGPTSHVAILAGGMALPALVAIGAPLESITDGTELILDATGGALTPDPAPAEREAAEAAIADAQRARAAAIDAAATEAHTADGTRIEAFANLASAADATAAVEAGAEGCGLLRTEFLFLDRANAPDEPEQAASYQAVADALAGRPLIVRLLDIGGDKPARYLPIAAEENPALGLRGIRVGLAHPELLAAQIRAILRVAPVGQCRIMVPMIASVAELVAVRAVLDAARADLGIADLVPLGVMIETPAAAVTADLIAAEADFLSIGSNDLTQYALAMDRGNAAVAAGVDGLHPAVLRLIGQACAGGARHGRWTGVCGGLASDPLAVPILIGLGVTELSATPSRVPEIKAAIRAATMADCRALAARATALSSAEGVRALAREFQRGTTA